MKKLTLSKNRYALVDDEDFEWVNQWRWSVNSCNYVIRKQLIDKKRVTITLHRLITNAPSNMQVDHINHDRLDNRKENLRICTRSQNCINRIFTKNTSGFRGVSWFKGRWQSKIEINGKKIFLGYFEDKIAAAKAYNESAKEIHKEYAKLNQV